MAAKQNTVAVVSELALPLVQKQQLTLWDVAFEKEGADWFLRVYLDREGGSVTIDDCEAVSRELSDLLDRTDPIEQSYYLEVSSPGLGRRLKKQHHFDACIGQPATVRLIRAVDGRREYVGVLQGLADGIVRLETEQDLLEVPLAQCSYVKLNDDLDLFA